MLNQKPKIFCIIPAFNEQKNIAKVLAQVKPIVDEVVVVDDGSTDKTAQIANQAGVVVLRHLFNRGQGAALQTGNQYALSKGADIIVHFDADGQFLAQEIKDVVRPIKAGEAQIVFGSRFLEKKSDIPKFKKYILLPIARLVNYLLLGVRFSDPQSGFRAFSRQAAQKIKIENDGMAHCSEILAQALKSGYKIKEVPITVIYHHFGQRLGGGVRIVKDLILARLLLK